MQLICISCLWTIIIKCACNLHENCECVTFVNVLHFFCYSICAFSSFRLRVTALRMFWGLTIDDIKSQFIFLMIYHWKYFAPIYIIKGERHSVRQPLENHDISIQEMHDSCYCTKQLTDLSRLRKMLCLRLHWYFLRGLPGLSRKDFHNSPLGQDWLT